MQPKLQRIFITLKTARAEGILESGLLDDFESGGNTRQIRFKLNKLLGKGSVTTKDGVWYLDKSYWDLSPVEFRDLIILYELSKNRRVVIASLSIAFMAVLILGILA